MARPREPLETRYGKLTVLGDKDLKTLVRCDCGTEKWVLRSNLRNGRINSCGAPVCRGSTDSDSVTPLSEDAIATLKAPAWIAPADIPGMWSAYCSDGKVMVIAQQYQVHIQTVYGLLKVIKAVGGIDPYMAIISGEKPAAPIAHNVPAVALAPGEHQPGDVPLAPPAVYRPKAVATNA
jgi:hypothetical protein